MDQNLQWSGTGWWDCALNCPKIPIHSMQMVQTSYVELTEQPSYHTEVAFTSWFHSRILSQLAGKRVAVETGTTTGQLPSCVLQRGVLINSLWGFIFSMAPKVLEDCVLLDIGYVLCIFGFRVNLGGLSSFGICSWRAIYLGFCRSVVQVLKVLTLASRARLCHVFRDNATMYIPILSISLWFTCTPGIPRQTFIRP